MTDHLKQLFSDNTLNPSGQLEHILTAEAHGITPGAPDLWCYRVTWLLENDTLAAAGHELAQLVDYALKTQHSEQFNREVRGCVHAFMNRCQREMGKA